MKWEEVRKLYPDQFVYMKVLNTQIKDNKEFIDDVAVIKPVSNPKEVTDLLVHGKDDDLVYHTANEQIILEVRNIRTFRSFV